MSDEMKRLPGIGGRVPTENEVSRTLAEQMQELAEGLLKCAPLILRNVKPYTESIGEIVADANSLAMKIQIELTRRGWLK